jgi:hypothetical protein
MAIIPPDADILPPSDDHIFKTLLTHPNAKPVLISVVAAVIERPVLDVIVRNNELPGSDVNEKKERLDVNCAIDGGDQVDVEMQCSHVETDTLFDRLSFINKSIYYLTDLHSSQMSKGVKYRDLVRYIINNLIQTKEEIKMATELLMEISQDERERAIMRSRRMYETDRINDLLVAEDRGVAKGKAEGMAAVFELLSKGVTIEEAKKRLGM